MRALWLSHDIVKETTHKNRSTNFSFHCEQQLDASLIEIFKSPPTFGLQKKSQEDQISLLLYHTAFMIRFRKTIQGAQLHTYMHLHLHFWDLRRAKAQISVVNDGTMARPASYNNLGPTPSGPVAFVVSSDISKSRTSCSDALTDTIYVQHFPFEAVEPDSHRH